MNIKLQNLFVNYGSKEILTNVSHCFETGKVNLIVGKSGCGKSTLLSVIAGFHHQSSGYIYCDDHLFEPDGNIALAFQNPEYLFFNSSVGEEVKFALINKGYSDAEADLSSKEWLSNWGIDPDTYFNRNPLELSGGEKRRVALASCTVSKPPVIMLDEPLAGLDLEGQVMLGKLIFNLSSQHCIIIVTHEPEVLLRPDSNILYIANSEGITISGADFYRRSLSDPDFYPLPRWYKDISYFS